MEFCLITYIVAVLFIALLSREPGSRDMISLIPFSTVGSTAQSHAYVVENIIMFIPFGFLLPQLWAHMRNLGLGLLSAFITSMVIEVTQVVTKMGYGQIDDVITNVIGAAIGFGILWTVQKIKITNRY
ncbi:VanZ family protein [Faecalicatena contorta]|uniref:VanZ family protein n=1 Tax=Faecalicatena contorta TaxID=39482 RepID=UPI001564E783|nr:VanZ family protein [Faecalicatena contorta]